MSGRSAARQKGSGVRVASIRAMIDRMRGRGHGANTRTAAAGSLRRGAWISVVALAAALAAGSEEVAPEEGLYPAAGEPGAQLRAALRGAVVAVREDDQGPRAAPATRRPELGIEPAPVARHPT